MRTGETYNVFVIGLDGLVAEQLEHIPYASYYNIIPLLSPAEIARAADYDMPALRASAQEQLSSFAGSIDGIATCWDFPSNLLAVCLRRALGLISPTLEAALKCEHKYWSRVEQSRVVPDLVPQFQSVDPFARNPTDQLQLAFPFWLKPVKSYASQLGFRINNAEDFREAISITRKGIARLGKPFDYFLDQANVPPDIRPVTGHHCVAEAIVSTGRQCTLEGYVQDGQLEVYGVVDSVRHQRRRSCFVRYEYPSNLPPAITGRMTDATRRVIGAIGLDNTPFNIEFYYDSAGDRIWLLEINTRISRSHTPLFKMVDGASHLKVMLDVCLGRPVHAPHRQGAWQVAAKFMERVFEDGMVARAPREEELAAVRRAFPESYIEIMVEEGQRLSDLVNQDAYSWEVADIFLGGRNRADLMRRHKEVMKMLPFEFEPISRPVSRQRLSA